MSHREEDGDGGEGSSWVVLRHTQTEGLGLLNNVLRDYGIHFRYLDLPRGEAPPRDIRVMGGLIVLGGPMGVSDAEKLPWLAKEISLVEKMIQAGRPVLGICLGAQMIAHALGARVYGGEKREVGWAPVTLTDDGREDALFRDVGPKLDVFHMHGDSYELPPDALNLATSSMYEQQAFSWGETVYGLQFHLEFTDAMIARLASEAESQAYIQGAGVDPAKLATESVAKVRAITDAAQQVFSAYFRQCGL